MRKIAIRKCAFPRTDPICSLLPSVENEEQMTQDMERYRRALQQRMSKAAVPNTQRLGMGGGPTKKREQSQKVELRSKIKP